MVNEAAPASPQKARMDAKEVRRMRQNLQDEVNGAALYDALAAAEKDPGRRSILKELAEVERGHAAVWAEKLRAAGEEFKAVPSARTRFLAFLARRLGARSVMPVAQALEASATQSYRGQEDAEALGLPRQERSHAVVFSQLATAADSAPSARQEAWHRASRGGNLRAAIFGVNDGLLSNFCLIMGMAGGTASAGAATEHQMILLAGFAGMIAGAGSMAAGEYVSVRSQRELFEREIEKESEELQASPEEEAKELELIYRAKGIPEEQARQLAASILANHDTALDTLAREELGLDPSELGSPWGAASSSFGAFVFGALVPLAPFFFTQGIYGVRISALVSGASLFAVGAALSIFTGKSPWKSGARMLLVGSAVAALTHLLGRLAGVAVG
jgi:VIT1/CCC1 family predicted Fe2+/Mn2+ transporter